MQLNPQVEGSHGIGSEHASSSDGSHSSAALMLMLKKDIEVMVFRTIEQQIVPIMENLVRNIVKEEIQLAQEKFFTSGHWNNADTVATSKERSLHLKFLDEVSVPVLTGQAIKGEGGTPLRVVLVDKITDQVVETGPESSAKVEIVVLEARDGDNEHELGLEGFNSRIIKEHNKQKPHFVRSNYIYLKKGQGELSKCKLAHDRNWMKNCMCRLGAQVVDNLNGLKVHEARTKPFMVSDSRGKLYGKRHPPSLYDDVWRLEKIGRGGNQYKRLKNENISTVQEFLFLDSVDPQKLRQIAGVGPKDMGRWEITVNHARTCIMDDKQIFVYLSPSNHENGIVFDVVGALKGIICDSHYVLNHHLSEEEKVYAHKLLLSAYENQNQRIPFCDEAALQRQYPCLESHAATIASIQEHDCEHTDSVSIQEHDCERTVSVSGSDCDPTDEPGTSSQSITAAIGQSGSLNDTVGQQDYSNWDDSNFSPNWCKEYLPYLETCGDSGNQMPLNLPEDTTLSATLNESQSRGPSKIRGILGVRVLAAISWSMFRARKRIVLAVEQDDVHVSKRQRT